MYRFVAAVLSTGLLFGQDKPPQKQLSPQDLLKEAIAFQQQGKLAEAIRDYDLFLDMYPDAAEIRSNLGAALVGVGRYAQAIAQYQLALLKKDDPKVRMNLAIAYYKAPRYNDAVRELTALRDADPANLQVVMLLASADLQLGNNNAVIELLTPLRRANPGDMGIAYLLGTALAREGESAQAEIVINDILSRGDSAEAHLLLGTTKFAQHDFNAALADLKRAVELNPNLPDVYSYYGMVLLVMGDAKGAKDAFRQELSKNPDNFDANLRLGALIRVDQDYESALPYLQRALSLRPGDPAVRYQLASIDMVQGKQEQAQREFEALVKESPQFTEAHVALATIYYREKRKQEGDHERDIVRDLNARKQAEEPAARTAAQ